jgi:ATP adenylyltransferase
MEFIRGSSRGEQRCFLCEAGRGGNDRETLVLFRGSASFCMLNRYPYNNGHLLISPFRHEGRIEALTPEEWSEMTGLIVEAKRRLDALMGPQGYNIGLNLGAPAGAGVADHLHFHVVPRWTGDTNFMTSIGSTKVIPQSLEELWRRLRGEADAEEGTC